MTAAVALSGGIDSLVAALILKNRNIPVFGIHFLTGYESARPGRQNTGQKKNDIKKQAADHPVKQMADQLGIPLHIIDCRGVFEKRIVKYFAETYRSGKTPNPCVLCNRVIKFGTVLEHAQKLGAEYLATGHYAKIDSSGDSPLLEKGADREKDQSYFLAMLSASQLSGAFFPLGGLEKNQVKKIARENGLRPVSGRESQDICFIQKENYAEFLESKGGIRIAPGPVVDTEGNVIGSHRGLHRFTVGQRRGINCPARAPYYVVRIDPQHNQLVVGFKNTLYKDYCCINRVNWLIPKPESPVQVKAKIRYRHHEADAMLEPGADDTAIIRFKEPQAAITPGQAAVCYTGDQVAAGGWIENQDYRHNG